MSKCTLLSPTLRPATVTHICSVDCKIALMWIHQGAIFPTLEAKVELKSQWILLSNTFDDLNFALI